MKSYDELKAEMETIQQQMVEAKKNERYVFNYKSYGNHLEFWGMPRTLVAGVEQVSEQWNGVVSIFHSVDFSVFSEG